METVELDDLMPAIATALSHDIKGIVGTIGRKARVVLSYFSPGRALCLPETREALLNIISQIDELYRATEGLRDAVRQNFIQNRAELANGIHSQILERIPGLQTEARKLSGEPAIVERPEDYDALRRAISRLEKILRTIVNSLADGSTPHFIQTNLVNHIDFAKESLADSIKSTNSEFIVTGAGSLIADQGSILIIFINLFENAVRYRAPERNLQVKINITKTRLQDLKAIFKHDFDRRIAPDWWFVVTVSDNGRGIDKQHWDKIFDFGYRVGPVQGGDDGSFGLGLSRCRELMRVHQGKIFLSESSTEGSTFTLVFPLDPREVSIMPKQ